MRERQYSKSARVKAEYVIAHKPAPRLPRKRPPITTSRFPSSKYTSVASGKCHSFRIFSTVWENSRNTDLEMYWSTSVGSSFSSGFSGGGAGVGSSRRRRSCLDAFVEHVGLSDVGPFLNERIVLLTGRREVRGQRAVDLLFVLLPDRCKGLALTNDLDVLFRERRDSACGVPIAAAVFSLSRRQRLV